jgi:hypothetical protein
LIDGHGGAGPLVNHVLHKWALDYPIRLGHQARTVTTCTPAGAIQGCTANVICMRANHFHRITPEQCFRDATGELHDWHDLAHVVGAAASKGRYGVKYQVIVVLAGLAEFASTSTPSTDSHPIRTPPWSGRRRVAMLTEDHARSLAVVAKMWPQPRLRAGSRAEKAPDLHRMVRGGWRWRRCVSSGDPGRVSRDMPD